MNTNKKYVPYKFGEGRIEQINHNTNNIEAIRNEFDELDKNLTTEFENFKNEVNTNITEFKDEITTNFNEKIEIIQDLQNQLNDKIINIESQIDNKISEGIENKVPDLVNEIVGENYYNKSEIDSKLEKKLLSFYSTDTNNLYICPNPMGKFSPITFNLSISYLSGSFDLDLGNCYVLNGKKSFQYAVNPDEGFKYSMYYNSTTNNFELRMEAYDDNVFSYKGCVGSIL